MASGCCARCRRWRRYTMKPTRWPGSISWQPRTRPDGPCGSPELPPGCVARADALTHEAAVGIVRLQHAVGVVAQLGEAEPVVALRHDVQRLLDRRCPLVFAHRVLGAIGCRYIGAAPVVVARDVQL